MLILVVGGGGREHALCHALAHSPSRPTVLCAPGNPGTAQVAENAAVAADDVDGLVALAQERGVDLVVVGPEVPLVAGLADRLDAAGIAVVGPSAQAAQLEGSKAFAKAFMARHGVPTAAYAVFSDLGEARAYVEQADLPLVLKADGLAAGKGVLICQTREEALDGLGAMLDGGAFGAAGATVVAEAFMEGEEASVFAVCDGADYVLLAPAQDHKRAFDGDEGPNTGGMGAYAPAPVVTPHVLARVEEEVVRPVLAGMAAEGMPYRGVLYVGLMIGTDGAPRVVEFNCRLGDPEAQVVLPLVASDVAQLFADAAHGRLAAHRVERRDGAAATVVVVSDGYPGAYPKGKPISGLDAAAAKPDTLVFHAGTKADGDDLVTSGGRVLAVTGLGATLADALDRAYAGVADVSFEGARHRTDIGRRGLAHLADG